MNRLAPTVAAIRDATRDLAEFHIDLVVRGFDGIVWPIVWCIDTFLVWWYQIPEGTVRCIAGWTGPTCTERSDPYWLAIASIILAITLQFALPESSYTLGDAVNAYERIRADRRLVARMFGGVVAFLFFFAFFLGMRGA